jgi:hypothetical protein
MEGLNMDEEIKAGEWIGKHLFAFPANHYDLADSEHGLTMRDYFAAKAMQGFLHYSATKGIYTPPDNELAKASYDLADAMLKARQE